MNFIEAFFMAVFGAVLGISLMAMVLREEITSAHTVEALIVQCETPLPRNQRCVLSAVPEYFTYE